MQSIPLWITFFLLLSLQGCGYLMHVDEEQAPKISFPSLYAAQQCPLDTPAIDLNKPWWLVYQNAQLNELIEKGLNANFSMQSAWERLKQSEAVFRMTGAAQYPALNIGGTAARTRTKSTLKSAAGNQKDIHFTNYFSGVPSISYAADLWGRFSSSTESSEALMRASRADVESTALILSGQIANVWLSAQVQKATLDLLRDQVELGRKLLKLTKLRFRVGQSSALDVYQQEEQLASTLSEVPQTRSAFRQTLNQLATLTGQLPSQIKAKSITGKIPDLPLLPKLNSPADILQSRPDLRALQEQLKSAQFDVATAVAERFPSLDFALTYNFNAEKISDIVNGQIGQVLGSLFVPLFEGGRLVAQVDERKANAEVAKNTLSEAVLNALQDVENSLIAEREQKKYASIIEDQARFAEARLRESRARYLHGASDYLEVTLALQSVQSLQRAQISNKSELLLTRNQLYLALGGQWTRTLNQSVAK